jgi:DNA-directed RNA polymerase specialized sigma24 family protein
MTEAQIVIGIMQNDNRAWQYICRNMKPSFSSIIGGMFAFGETFKSDIDDIFQDSCIILMQKVKSGGLVLTREGALFSYLVQIGKLTACNLMRKRRGQVQEEKVSIRGTEIPDLRKEMENEPGEISISEKQQMQNEFLDRVFDSIQMTARRS